MADPTEIIINGLVATVAAAIASVTTYLVKRKPAIVMADAAHLTAESAAQNSVNDGFAKLNAALMKRMDEQDAAIASLKDTIQEQSGEIENLTQHVYSLEKILRDNGLPIPIRQRPQVFSVIPGTKQ